MRDATANVQQDRQTFSKAMLHDCILLPLELQADDVVSVSKENSRRTDSDTLKVGV
jgi:hypothetical protein